MPRYGWLKDRPDQRDLRYAMPGMALSGLPPLVDLSKKSSPVYNQDDLGACTANAIASAFVMEEMRQTGLPVVMAPSRLFIYYNERRMEGTVKVDAGAFIRDGVKSLAKEGVCNEKDWPYKISQFAKKPPSVCYKSALDHQVVDYRRVPQVLNHLKACLYEGHGFVFGFTVYESFESELVAAKGNVQVPGNTEAVLGGHAVFCVGYDDSKRCFIVQNSWGTAWGDKGFCYMPYEYLTNPELAADFWTLRLVEV